MCIITRFAVVPRGCKNLINKHVVLATETAPCPQRITEAQAARGLTNTKVDVPLCPPAECTVVDSFSSRVGMVRYRAAIEKSCAICLGETTQTQALCGPHDALPAQYAIFPGGAILKEAGLPDLDLSQIPVHKPRRDFDYDPRYYKNTFRPNGFWHVWNRCCMIEHEQKERRVTMNEHLGLQLMLNQILKYKDETNGKLRAWNQELLPDIPGAAFFEEDEAGNFHLRGRVRARKV